MTREMTRDDDERDDERNDERDDNFCEAGNVSVGVRGKAVSTMEHQRGCEGKAVECDGKCVRLAFGVAARVADAMPLLRWLAPLPENAAEGRAVA